MKGELVKYDAAVKALAECVRVDEAKSLQDKAAAAQAYARQANDPKLLAYATEIRMRAQRKVGELLIQMPKAKPVPKGSKLVGGEPIKGGGRGSGKGSGGGKDGFRVELPSGMVRETFADLGISGKQAFTWQKLAKLPRKEFEEKVAVASGAKPKPKSKNPKRRKIVEEMSKVELDDVADAPTEDRPENIATAFHLRMDQGIVFCEEAVKLADEMFAKLPKRKKEFADTARALLLACEKLVAHIERG